MRKILDKRSLHQGVAQGRCSRGSVMVSTHEKLKQLLDGDLDMAELENDPALASLAHRLYGIKIANVNPQKNRTTPQESSQFPQPTEVTNLYVETTAPSFPEASLPPTMSNELPPAPTPPKKKKSRLATLFLLGFTTAVSNVFGLFGMLTNNPCNPEHYCPVDGHTRFNFLYPLDMENGYAWSLPITDGAYGIPDIVAIVGCLILFMWFRGKK